MKKFFFLPMLSTLLMVGCSQEDPSSAGGDEISDGTTSYMAVNMVSSDANVSRADDYEYGTSGENEVKFVRFYFFTANGAAAPVKLLNGQYVNFYDWTKDITGTDSETGNVSKTLTATIVINTKEGDKLPQKIVAVLNPSEATKSDKTSKSLSDLQTIVKDYAADAYTQNGSFVMFNSVHGGNDAANLEKVCESIILKNNLKTDPEEAKLNPVKIYVERCVAKVMVYFGPDVTDATTAGKKLALKDKDGNDLKIGGENGKQVYLKINGWDLTAETSNSRLVKAIDLNWTESWWNNGENRSCWALNSSSANNVWGTYNNVTNGLNKSLYTNENACKYVSNGSNPAPANTKVILSGTLCDESGNSLTIVRHLGAYFADTYSETPSENLPELKKNILSQLSASNKHYYYDAKEGDKTVRKEITTDCLLIVPADQKPEEDSKNNCYVYAQLTEEAKGHTWYTSDAESATPIGDATKSAASIINDDLKNKELINWALVWKNGMTYYYYEINHRNAVDDEQAVHGVVRNHVYKTTVTKIAGLGTPVYDPSKTIYPEKPDPNDHYIAAQIYVLSWHIVTSDYELEW